MSSHLQRIAAQARQIAKDIQPERDQVGEIARASDRQRDRSASLSKDVETAKLTSVLQAAVSDLRKASSAMDRFAQETQAFADACAKGGGHAGFSTILHGLAEPARAAVLSVTAIACAFHAGLPAVTGIAAVNSGDRVGASEAIADQARGDILDAAPDPKELGPQVEEPPSGQYPPRRRR